MLISMTTTQSRKWLLTVNNPAEYDLDHEKIKDLIMLFNPTYFCMVDEIATTGTYHTHIFIYSSSPIRFITIKNRLPVAHIDKAKGTAYENRDYLRKSGKWENSIKEKTNLINTFEEYGKIPQPQNENAPGMAELIDDIENGLTTYAIIKRHPKYSFKTKDIDSIRQTYLAEKYSNRNRNLTVTYIYGKTGTGKTSGIFQNHNANEICRITNYRKNNGVYFDHYNGHKVLVFEEFASQIPVEEMLNYLDIYPLMLPARFNDKVACYDTVYITSNIPLEHQYKDVQTAKPETWKAFLRRIHYVTEYTEYGVYTTRKSGG